MDDAVLFNGCIINQEVIFNANMNELRPLAGGGECISLNAPTARCLLLLLQNRDKVISRDEFLASVWETRGIVVSQNTFYQNISLLRKSLVKAGLSEDIIITVRQKGFSVAPDTLIIPLSDEECENMNRSTLMNYPGNKGGDVIPSGREKADLKLSLPLVENISKQDADWRKNSVEETGKVSERLHVTFKIPLWLIALIVVMIAINIIVLVMLHR
ncbi:TPA: transcriptional regulator [Klebsiella quasipneumoniae]|uniref:winged helix-turn-helix domain-containing protein n=1 Tax=Klebsiella quasipneumoniae TaxID=1463165 RepID=UPI001F4F01DB|nr:winged helix-turn-helix domain-containing protein [Klebsiella quasipneumoniae]MCH9429850.1 winged helix-turn-helix domain-containing protein [Klebsiella quasipneumoniae]MCT8889705.1 winged helix-turn-helix domain-containing protein [Klebsiella quasipneumoniae subsp. similipneumoniae]HCI6406175.1 winged helix-turn-helix domain-containing protein [Klebsiella quasipneumoniae subsp. similipneumoniae]HCI6654264.1 winged helix-turn-helix domain-containing protein [Klebsiella quasipneumoniae subsp.